MSTVRGCADWLKSKWDVSVFTLHLTGWPKGKKWMRQISVMFDCVFSPPPLNPLSLPTPHSSSKKSLKWGQTHSPKSLQSILISSWWKHDLILISGILLGIWVWFWHRPAATEIVSFSRHTAWLAHTQAVFILQDPGKTSPSLIVFLSVVFFIFFRLWASVIHLCLTPQLFLSLLLCHATLFWALPTHFVDLTVILSPSPTPPLSPSQTHTHFPLHSRCFVIIHLSCYSRVHTCTYSAVLFLYLSKTEKGWMECSLQTHFWKQAWLNINKQNWDKLFCINERCIISLTLISVHSATVCQIREMTPLNSKKHAWFLVNYSGSLWAELLPDLYDRGSHCDVSCW